MENRITPNNTEENFEKELNKMIEHEEEEILHERKEIIQDEKELKRLKELKHELEEKHQHDHEKKVCLKFIVNGSPFEINENENVLLKKAVEDALHKSGNDSRPLPDWKVRFNNQVLDINKKIKDFHFPECAELFLSLIAGKGGSW